METIQLVDTKTLPSVRANLFGPQSWNLINEFIMTLNSAFQVLDPNTKINSQPLNFLVLMQNPSVQTKFTGTLKQLFIISQMLWNYLTTNRQPYSIQETKNLILKLSNQINLADFNDIKALSSKEKLIKILNNWNNLLG